MKSVQNEQLVLKDRILDHLNFIYPESNNLVLLDLIRDIMGFEAEVKPVASHINLWDETDIVTITYGDTIRSEECLPLHSLYDFLDRKLRDTVSIVHILPFYPYSSDDGFAVINYVEVNHSLGDWKDIRKISNEFSLMADLVINHISSRSLWFDNYKSGKEPGKDYFMEMDPDTDLSQVVRPRTSPLLRETETLDGTKYVWCTFSHDQIDLDFRNPSVLVEFVKIIKTYLDNGVSLFRLDAVAFLWKELGTSCMNLPQTHEVIRLLRLLIEHVNPRAIVITETNIPNRENLSYFGNANEAHWIYNFTLPPLILYTMYSGRSHLIKQWLMSMPPAQNGTAYFNFIASHDGIGLRPVEGILTDEQVGSMAETVKEFGGEISWRTLSDGSHRPYELNISLFDAFSGTFEGKDDYQIQRHLCSHAIMLALEGVPAFYIHSLLGTHNDQDKKEASGQNRAINRHNWDRDELLDKLEQPTTHADVFNQLVKLIGIRKQQKAFHPNATQFTMHFSDDLFAFWRQSLDRKQSIFCIFNITNQPQELALKDVNLIELEQWHDLISGHLFNDPREVYEMEPYQFVWITNSKKTPED